MNKKNCFATLGHFLGSERRSKIDPPAKKGRSGTVRATPVKVFPGCRWHLFQNFFVSHSCCSDRGASGKKKLMTVDQFVDFLNRTQRDPRLNEILHPYANSDRAKDLIREFEPNKQSAQRGLLSFDGFLKYLMSADNPIVSSSTLELNNDMDQPLSHYFINSSHNTYLTGNRASSLS